MSVVVYRSVSDDHSRVKLQNVDNDYINASLVSIEEAQRSYVLTQASGRQAVAGAQGGGARVVLRHSVAHSVS